MLLREVISAPISEKQKKMRAKDKIKKEFKKIQRTMGKVGHQVRGKSAPPDPSPARSSEKHSEVFDRLDFKSKNMGFKDD